MKTIFIGDIHGKTIWKDIIDKENADRIIIVGDYFDTHDDISTAEQIFNFEEIIRWKESVDNEIIMLIGNHDFQYMKQSQGEIYSGYQSGGAISINNSLEANLHHLQMAYQFDDIICTHAGISWEWLDANFRYLDDITKDNLADTINDLWRYTPNVFKFDNATGYSPTGNHPSFSPIWIRPWALMKANKANGWIKNELIQIVGHTYQKKIDFKGKSTGGRYYFIDALPSKQYLIYENNEFKLGQL